ncbi:restriction endonuclease subunit S [Cellulomonas taurus]|uniref:restriction endonuclease subunit S n=1 Tax=Cellulomonas taurus TaxID=2729175 RepID=UPI00145F4041|nr:restriction endonuclease subunit S [Cellulomonas taurus]
MFSDLKPYPADVRSTWTTLRLGAVGSIFKSNGGSKEDDADLGVPCIRYGDLYTRYRTAIRRVERAVRTDVADRYTKLEFGDLLFAASGETTGDIGRSAVNLVEGEVRASGDIVVCRPARDVNPEFLALAVDTPAARQQKSVGATGTMIIHITSSVVKTLRVDLPPLEEQAAIVRYLAHAHRRIDRAIAAKRKLIALLEEQKRAIINQAVTRGLDPTVPLKDTGIPWLGKAPEHWQAVRFKHRVGFQEGPGIMAAEFRDAGIPLLRISCMAGPEVDLHGCNFLGPEAVEERWAKFRVNAGDYLLSASGSTGTVKPVGEVAIGAVPYTGLIRLWPRDGDVDMEFIRLSMTSAPFASQIDQAKSGVGIEHFGPTHLKRMWIAMPPIKEQMAIVANVASATAAIDASAGVARRGVEILREFRTRLTSDVVTGQVDVRHIAATLPDLDPDEFTADVSAMDDGLVDEAAEFVEEVDA